MKNTLIRDRKSIIGKLRELGFFGPYKFFHHEYMIYHGTILMLPTIDTYSTPQFRQLFSEIDQIVSDDEWSY